MSEKMKIPPIVKLGAWLLSLIVFVVGFWHTHLGLQQMKPFNSEYGSIAIAAIVLILLLITYWFAVNGKKMALIFYIVCGFFFFIFNLNYFYPAYMARTLIKEEAKTLKDTIDSYSKTNKFSTREQFAQIDKIREYRDEIKSQVEIDGGFGDIANKYLNKFNEVAGTEIDPPNQLKFPSKDAENQWFARLDNEIQKWEIRNAGEGLADATSLIEGVQELEKLRIENIPALEKIAVNDEDYRLDSIRFHPNVEVIKSTVEKINSAVIKMNKGSKREILKELKKEEYPRADKLGTIKHTITSIFERIKEIDTWSIILVCLFIDLLVPLAIYLLLRKSDSDSDTPEQTYNRPSNFNRTY